MNKKGEMIRKGILITLDGFVALAISFMFVFLVSRIKTLH